MSADTTILDRPTSQKPGLIGLSKAAIDTPALLVDVDVLESNIKRIADVCRANKVSWRPHIKGQKVIEIAKMELAAGAIGVTCAKLGEAEVMADAGIREILIANQIAGKHKIERLMDLLPRAHVMVAVDSEDNIAALGAAAAARGQTLDVLIEIDTGMRRAGLLPGDAAAAMAQRISKTPGLRFKGLMAWEGHTVRIADPAEKQQSVQTAVESLVKTAEAVRKSGIPVEIVSCGGTGTYALAAPVKGVTEIQAGGGVFSDLVYRKQYNIDHPYALTILSTITSRPNPQRIVCDTGKKGMSADAAMPEPVGIEGVASVRLSAEHAIIELDRPNTTLKVGDTIEFVVGYTDTTVHLHEEMYAMRNGKIVGVWPISARGKSR
jgi:D-serine deaminase-like pyridoxal phosphate-dependent protein